MRRQAQARNPFLPISLRHHGFSDVQLHIKARSFHSCPGLTKCWIASRSLPSGARSRDPLACNDMKPSRLHGALRAGVDRIKRCRAADIESVSLLAAEAQIGNRFGYVDLAQ